MGMFDFLKKKKGNEVPTRIPINLVIYSVVGKNGDGIAEKIKGYFGDEVESSRDVKSEDGSPIGEKTRFFSIRLKDGMEVNGKVVENINVEGLAEHFSQSNISDENLKQMILIQISLFNCAVELNVEYDHYDGRKEEMRKIFSKIANIGSSMDGYTMLDEKRLYAPNGKIFISLNEGSDFKEFTPFVPQELVDKFEMTKKDNARMTRNIQKIKALGLPYIENMHTSISEAQAVIPDEATIIKRAVAMIVTGVASELYYSKDDDTEEIINKATNIYNEKYKFSEVLTESERRYLNSLKGTEKENIEYNWRYESAAMLLWALSVYELPDLKTVCNVVELGQFVRSENLRTLTEKSQMRSKDEIMDMLDYLYRLNWSAVEFRIRPKKYNNQKFPYDESIIHFRRLALEWLVQPEKNIEDVEAEMHT